jgi:hypothetical protein
VPERRDPDTLRLVPVAAPIIGVISVGVFASTGAPVPVTTTHAGTPDPFVSRPALLAAARPVIVLLAEEYNN